VKILVTGAAGFIGSHLCERLVDLGHDVRGLDCFTDYYAYSLKALNYEDVLAKGVTWYPLDLAEDNLGTAVDGIEVVYHLAAQPGISASTPFDVYERNNIRATYRLLQALSGSPTLKMLVNVGTSSIYGADATCDEETVPRPTSYYCVTKLAAEQLILASCRDQGMPACSLRLFSVYGPRERPEKLFPKLIKCMMEDQAFPLFEGSRAHLRSFTYVGDIIDGFVAVLEHMDICQGEIFNIGTDQAITTGEAITIVEEIVGHPARFDLKPRRPGDQLKTHANIAKARRLLDYVPRTTPEQGLRKVVNWYRQRIHGKVDF